MALKLFLSFSSHCFWWKSGRNRCNFPLRSRWSTISAWLRGIRFCGTYCDLSNTTLWRGTINIFYLSDVWICPSPRSCEVWLHGDRSKYCSSWLRKWTERVNKYDGSFSDRFYNSLIIPNDVCGLSFFPFSLPFLLLLLREDFELRGLVAPLPVSHQLLQEGQPLLELSPLLPNLQEDRFSILAMPE